MRVSDVYASAAALTGDNGFESAKFFIYHLNRSIDQVSRIRPFETYVTLAHYRPETVLAQEDAFLTMDDSGTSFSGQGVTGITFDICGGGTYTVRLSTGAEKLWVVMTKPGQMVKQKINIKKEFTVSSADVTLTISKGFRISNLALFSSFVGDDVPAYGEYCEYKIKDMVDDFIDFADLPLCHDEQYLDEAYYRLGKDSVMMIPRTAPEGLYDVWYRRKARPVPYTDSPENDDTEIDIREGMEDLLVLLLAYYMNEYSEPEAAEVFRRDYSDHLQTYLRNMQIPREGAVMNKNGWM